MEDYWISTSLDLGFAVSRNDLHTHMLCLCRDYCCSVVFTTTTSQSPSALACYGHKVHPINVAPGDVPAVCTVPQYCIEVTVQLLWGSWQLPSTTNSIVRDIPRQGLTSTDASNLLAHCSICSMRHVNWQTRPFALTSKLRATAQCLTVACVAFPLFLTKDSSTAPCLQGAPVNAFLISDHGQ